MLFFFMCFHHDLLQVEAHFERKAEPKKEEEESTFASRMNFLITSEFLASVGTESEIRANRCLMCQLLSSPTYCHLHSYI